MASSPFPISYATAAASTLHPAQLPDHKDETDGLFAQKDEVPVISPSFNASQIEVNMQVPLAVAKIGSSDEVTRTDDPSSLISTSISTSDDSEESQISLISQTSPDNASNIEIDHKRASIVRQPTCTRPVVSAWTGAALNRSASADFNPLASIGTAAARPLSPPVSRGRKSRFSQFFSNKREIGDDSGSPESPFFPDGLSGGLISAMSDIKVQQQKMGEDVEGYITSHYASPSSAIIPQPGTKSWDQYIASVQAAMDAMPKTVSGNPLDLSQAHAMRGWHQTQTALSGNVQLPVTKYDGASLKKSMPTVHNPRAAPFVPRRTTTIENLEEVAVQHGDRKSLTVTRPRSSWDQVSNWRSRGKGKGAVCRQTSHPGRGKKPQDIHPPPTGPRVLSTSSKFPSTPTAQDLTTSQSSSSALAPIVKRDTTRRTFEPFRPMNAVLNPDAYKQPLSKEQVAFRLKNGISLNYHGNHDNSRNISAKIPDEQNCAIWVTNLPANCTTKDLLQALMHHRPGRVWATHINAPEEPKHRHAAAKVVFYHPEEAKRLLNFARKPGIFVQDQRISAIYNKQRVAAQEYSYPTSRALEIRGDKAIVNEEFLRSLFQSHFKFEDEAVEVLAEFDSVRVIEWRFGSMRAQAGSAYKLLERMYPCVTIRYATDPCAQYMDMPDQKHFDLINASFQDGVVSQDSLITPGDCSTSRS